MDQLPLEILLDIFSRLPAKSVGRCRCVAKPWRTLLSTAAFIKFHLSRSYHHETLFLIYPSGSFHTLSIIGCPNILRTDDLGGAWAEFVGSCDEEKKDLGGNWVEFVGSCNGLVLLVNDENVMFLVNPTTLEQVEIPDPPLAMKVDEDSRFHGFGYDNFSDDYKIVTLSYDGYDLFCVDIFMEVYSVKMDAWKMVDPPPYDNSDYFPSSGAFVNGAIHWLVARSRYSGCPSVIAAFDLASEVFHELPPPNGVHVDNTLFNKLTVLGGCLCMLVTRGGSHFQHDVWIMKEYGLADSWMKFSLDLDYGGCDLREPLCFIGDVDDSDVVLLSKGKTLVSFNREEGSLMEMLVNDFRVEAIDGGTFVESLVSPTADMDGRTMGQVPQEILMDIFSRLPAKTVGRCRCVAKTWQTLLSTSEFIKFHLSRSSHYENLLLISPSRSNIHTLSIIGHPNVLQTDDLGGVWAEFVGSCDEEKEDLGGNWDEFVGSCNGLVWLLNKEHVMFLVNPTTLELVEIPDPPLAREVDEDCRLYGFGYDSCSDDYKIVTLSYDGNDPFCVDTFVEVYSVKMDFWKMVDSSPYDHSDSLCSSGVFINGAIHWLAARSRYSGCLIAAFDLASEVFHELPPPNGFHVKYFVFNKLTVLGGCLCMLDRSSHFQADVWIMKEYGLADSWMKFSLDLDYCSWELLKPLCFIGDIDDSDVVLMTQGNTLVLSNREEGSLMEMLVDGFEVEAFDAGTFIESLVSPLPDFDGVTSDCESL